MKLLELFQHLNEYKRNITVDKLGDKLVAAAKRDQNQNLDEILSVLEQIDPTRNKMYVEWLCKQYIAVQFRLEDYPRINNVLSQFENAKSRMQQKDINKYTFRSLEDEMDKIYNVDLDKDKDGDNITTGTFPVVPDSEVLYNGPLGQLSIPKTEEASCELGRGTKWCTAAKNNNKFSYYNEKGPLYIWRDKNGEKYQFHFNPSQFTDVKDTPVDHETLNYFRTKHPILSKLFKQKEKEIVKDPAAAAAYAKNVIKGRWPEAEPYIIKDPAASAVYAEYVIKGRWPEAEPYIIKDLKYAYYYANYVIRGRWPEAEPYIMKSPRYAYWYAKDIIKGRWPEAEPYIMKKPRYAGWYARDVINGPWPEAGIK